MKQKYSQKTHGLREPRTELAATHSPYLLCSILQNHTHELRHKELNGPEVWPEYALRHVDQAMSNAEDKKNEKIEKVAFVNTTFAALKKGVREPEGERWEFLAVGLMPKVAVDRK